jgi:hypothetical protein
VPKRISQPAAGRDQIGAIGTVDIAAVAETGARNGTEFAWRSFWRFWILICIGHGGDGRN